MWTRVGTGRLEEVCRGSKVGRELLWLGWAIKRPRSKEDSGGKRNAAATALSTVVDDYRIDKSYCSV